MSAFTNADRFARLDPKDRDRLESLAKLDEYTPGTEIVAGGKHCDSLCLIASGMVEVRVPTSGGDVAAVQLGPGDIFGEVEYFAELPPSVRHVARDDVIVRAVSKNPLKHELVKERKMAVELLYVYCRSLSEKIRHAIDVYARLSDGTAKPTQSDRTRHMSEEEAGWIALLGERIECKAGERPVHEGDRDRSFYMIQEGEVLVRKQAPDGSERELANLGPRDLFGFMAFLDGRPRSASVVTTSYAVLTRVSEQALDHALRLNFTVSFKFLSTLCEVLARTLVDTLRQISSR